MASSLGTAVVAIRAETSKLGSDIDKGVTQASNNATRQLGGLQGAMKGVGVAATLAIAGVAAKAIFEFGKAAVDAASTLEESMNAVDVSFGNAAAGIHALGDDSVEAFGLSEAAFNKFAVQFSAFGEGIAQASGRNVVEVVEEMATRIADFASVMDLELTEAATVFQSGLAGETEAFRRFGVDVSAAAVEVKAMEMGLGDASGALTEQDKILGRYELIMEQTEKTAGDFANTSDSLANQQRKLAGAVEDVQAKIGSLLIPKVSQATGVMADLTTILDVVLEKFTAIGSSEEGAPGVTDAFIGMIPVVGQVVNGFTNFANALGWVTDKFTGADAAAVPVMESMGALERVSQELDAQLTTKTTPSVAALERASLELDAALAEVTGAQYEAIGALQDFEDEVRSQIDPVFALEEAHLAVVEAQAALTAVEADFAVGTPEWVAAVGELARANLDLEGANLGVVAAGQLTRAEFVKQQIELGLSVADANAYADALEAINAFVPEPIDFKMTVNGQTFGSVAAVERAIQGVGKASGGPVMAGSPYIVGEIGRELFIPNVSGQIINNRDTEAILAGGDSYTANIYVQGGVAPSTVAQIEAGVENALRKLAREAKVR